MIQPITLVLVLLAIVSANAYTAAQQKFQLECLTYHNTLRAKHCAPALQLDDTLNQVAQTYAEKLAAENKFEHSGNQYGENLYTMESSVPIKILPGMTPTQTWYDENKDYDYTKPGFVHAAGHFTQVIWKGSKKLGCGLALTSDGKTALVVANYDPYGNVDGQYGDHVHAPTC